MGKTEAYKKLVEHFGGQTATAKALGVRQATVCGWVKGVHGMSAVVAMRAERVTDGEFSAASLNELLEKENDAAA